LNSRDSLTQAKRKCIERQRTAAIKDGRCRIGDGGEKLEERNIDKNDMKAVIPKSIAQIPVPVPMSSTL
jgi:hypothetical protein